MDNTTVKHISGAQTPSFPYACIQNRIDYLIGHIGAAKVFELLEMISQVESIRKLSSKPLYNNGILVEFIITTVCENYSMEDFEKCEFLSSGRTQRFIDARTICVYLLRKFTNLTLEKIGQMFGGRTKAGIRNNYEARMKGMYGVKTIEFPLVTRCEEISKEIEVFISLTSKFNVYDPQIKDNEAA